MKIEKKSSQKDPITSNQNYYLAQDSESEPNVNSDKQIYLSDLNRDVEDEAVPQGIDESTYLLKKDQEHQ